MRKRVQSEPTIAHLTPSGKPMTKSDFHQGLIDFMQIFKDYHRDDDD